jgi:hypothetical protein
MKRTVAATVLALILGNAAWAGIPENPKVQPGLVNWHPNFEQACAASKTTGRPVLLFQMMGKLDDQFC